MCDNNISNISAPKTGAIYIRVSTERQEELSPDAQRRLLLEYAKDHHIAVPEKFIFQDNGISGRKARKRPSFQNMIALAKSKEHPIDIIIVWKFSRFARNQEESIVYKSLLKRNGVDVVSVSEPLADGPFGSLIERIIEWMDEYYSIRLSGEVMRGMTENAMRGNYQSHAPIGYRSPGNGAPPVIDSDTAKIPLLIKDLFLSGFTTLQIARRLNELGYQTKHGNPWEARGVRYVLENPFYAGKSRWNYTERGRRLKPADEVIYADGKWKPLWDKETATRIQQRLAMNTRKAKSRDVSAVKHWLSGLLVCSACGATLSYTGTGNQRGFQCWKYGKGQCSESHFIKVTHIEALITDYLEILLDSEYRTYTVSASAPADPEHRPDGLQRRLQRLAAREKRIRAAYQSGIDTLEEYRENKKMLDRERYLLEEALHSLTSTANEENRPLPGQNTCRSIHDLLQVIRDDSADHVIKGKMMRNVIDHIVFDRKNTSLDVFLKLVI